MRTGFNKARWSRPLADYVRDCINPALARHGFGEADIVTGWADIVGARVAAWAEPLRLQRRRGPARGEAAAEPATLIVRVEGGFALELQHLAPLVIERINIRLGWRCVGRLAFRQGPLGGRPGPAPARRPPEPGAIARARAATTGIDDDPLRDALARLGARVLKPGP